MFFLAFSLHFPVVLCSSDQRINRRDGVYPNLKVDNPRVPHSLGCFPLVFFLSSVSSPSSWTWSTPTTLTSSFPYQKHGHETLFCSFGSAKSCWFSVINLNINLNTSFAPHSQSESHSRIFPLCHTFFYSFAPLFWVGLFSYFVLHSKLIFPQGSRACSCKHMNWYLLIILTCIFFHVWAERK